MSTTDDLKALALSGDSAAATVLHKNALRKEDKELLAYLGMIAEKRLGELRVDIDRWKSCLPSVPLVMTRYGHNSKIPAIKLIREITGLGLKEAKKCSEAVPALLVEFCDRTLALRYAERAACDGVHLSTEYSTRYNTNKYARERLWRADP
jgi:hypothetical protein